MGGVGAGAPGGSGPQRGARGAGDQGGRARRRSTPGGRELLVGLVALAVLAPDEALWKACELLDGGTLNQWYLATYALRYVRRPQAVPLLERDLDLLRGFVEGAAGTRAIHAMELLMDPDAREQLAEVSRHGRGELAQAARVARFRLGDISTVSELSKDMDSLSFSSMKAATL